MMLSNLSLWLPGIIILLAAIASALKDFLFSQPKTRREKIFGLALFVFLVLGGLCSFWLTFSSNEQAKNIEQQNQQIIRQNNVLNQQLSETKEELAQTKIELYKRTGELVAKSGKIEQLNDFILSSVTGGESYCYLLPMFDDMSGRQRFFLTHEGKYPVYDIQVRIINISMLGQLPFDKLLPKGNISKENWQRMVRKRDLWQEFHVLRNQAEILFALATLTPGTGFFINGHQLPEGAEKQEYLVDIFARNGKVSQEIRYVKEKGSWKISMRVVVSGHEGKGRVVLEWPNQQ